MGRSGEPSMQGVTTVGLDIGKSVFQVHGVNAAGNVLIRRQLKRRYVLKFFPKLPPCLVGIEACATSHRWSRELQAIGHTVRLMPPAHVKPCVKRQKNDLPTPRRSAKRSPDQTCGSWRQRPPSGRAA
jgi:transposase